MVPCSECVGGDRKRRVHAAGAGQRAAIGDKQVADAAECPEFVEGGRSRVLAESNRPNGVRKGRYVDDRAPGQSAGPSENPLGGADERIASRTVSGVIVVSD